MTKAKKIRMVDGPLVIQLDGWKECGPPENPRALLTGRGRLGGCLLLAEAIEVVRNEFDGRQAAHPENDAFLDAAWDAFSMEGAGETVEIAGREYLVFIAPGC